MNFKPVSGIAVSNNFNWKAVFYGTLLAVIASIILMAVGGTIMFYTVFNEQYIPVIGLAILSISVFVGGLISARKAGKFGLAHGIGVGLVFLLLTILFNIAVPGGIFSFAILKKIIASLVAGSLGGIWGVGR